MSDVSARVEALTADVKRALDCLTAISHGESVDEAEVHESSLNAYAAVDALALQAEEAQRELTRADGDGVRLLREKQAAEQRLVEMEREANAGYEGRDFWKSACEDERKKVEELEAALREADRLAEWVRVTVSVEGVFSNNIGAQAQAQGLSNLLTAYFAARALAPATPEEPT